MTEILHTDYIIAELEENELCEYSGLDPAVLFAAARPAPPPIMMCWSATKTGGGAVDFCTSKI